MTSRPAPSDALSMAMLPSPSSRCVTDDETVTSWIFESGTLRTVVASSPSRISSLWVVSVKSCRCRRTCATIGLTKPFDGNAATVGNGVMVALEAKDQAQVQRLYDIALANGGTDEGAPGDRGGGFYAGYFRDPDGNKLNAFVMKGE